MYEPLRISGVGRAEDGTPLRGHGSGFAEMHYSRREQRQARVVMLVVVPVEEPLAEAASVLDAAEPVG